MRSRIFHDYHVAGDVLHVFRGQPYDTTNIELDQHFTLRLDPRTAEVVGIIIHQYSVLYPSATQPRLRTAIAAALLDSLALLHKEQKLKEPSVA